MGATIDEIIDSLKRGQGKRVSDLVKMALEEGTDPQMILEDGFLAGMEQVCLLYTSRISLLSCTAERLQ